MLLSLALIMILGLAIGQLFEKIHLPRLIGMLAVGIILGPYVLNLLDSSILDISSDLREIALIIILIKAGLALNIKDLKKVGRPAILMSFLPACFEILGIVIFAPLLLGITYAEAALIGAVLGAVSPAVVVPKMVTLMEEGRGTDKSIPQLILAGASLDDVFVIVLFGVFCGMVQGVGFSAVSFIDIPVSIIFGIVIGALIGILAAFIFGKIHMRDSVKVIIVIGISFALVAFENFIANYVAFSGLIAVMTMACFIQIRKPIVAERLSKKFSKLWVVAEIMLFVLVGAAVDIRYAVGTGFIIIGLIFIGLLFRTVGVFVSMIKTDLSFKERIFCTIAYIPKATVQAAIGAVPLAMGLPIGQLVLTVAVVSILLTAPLGALGIDLSSKKFLSIAKRQI